jgi:predicted ribosomally synthesized peptide with SipW-like signal peptide
MTRKKIGLLCLALVLALGALGVGYASWHDVITVDGTVNTGTLDLSVDNYTGTWVYKDVEAGTCIESTEELDLTQYTDYMLVAYAYAEQDPSGTDHDVLVTFHNLFPCVYFTADFDVHFTGTVPANLTVQNLTVTGADPSWVAITGFPEGQQVDEDTTFHVAITIHVPQPANGQDGQGLDGEISGQIVATQWNEDAYVPGG